LILETAYAINCDLEIVRTYWPLFSVGEAVMLVAMEKLILIRCDDPTDKIELLRWQVALRGFFRYT